MGEEICSSITFECSSCNFRTKKYGSDWRRHLLEEGHQERAREGVKWMTIKTKGRSVVVFGVRRIPPAAILKYLGDLQLVMEFVFWEERKDLCIVTLLSPTFRESLTKQSHILQNERLFFRSLDEIPEAEWISICPFAVVPDEVEIMHDESEKIDDDFNESDEGEMPEEDAETREVESSRTDSGNGSGGSVPLCSKKDGGRIPARIKVERQGSESAGFEEGHRSIIGENMEFNWDQALNNRMASLYNQYLMAPEGWNCRQHAKKWIENILSAEFPNCVVIPYGSGGSPMSGIANHYSCFLDVEGFTKENSSGGNVNVLTPTVVWMRNIMAKVESTLETPSYHSIIKILNKSDDNACHLVFRFTDPQTNSNVTGSLLLSTSNFMGVQNSRLVEFMCTLDDRVRPLLIIARHWSCRTRLIRRGRKLTSRSFGPLAMQMLVVTFLINKKVLPSIEDLKLACSSPLILGTANIGFDTNTRKWKKDVSFETVNGFPSARCVLTLALEMFAYYGKIVLEDAIVSPYIGGILSKKSKKQRKLFRCAASWKHTLSLKKASYPMTIQHPFIPSANLSSNIDSHFSKLFLDQCLFTADLLNSLLNTRSSFRDPIDLLATIVPESFNPVSAVQVQSMSNGEQGTKRKKTGRKATPNGKKHKN